MAHTYAKGNIIILNEVEISGLFTNSVVSHDVFWKLSCERASDVFLNTDPWEGAWRLGRVWMEPHRQWGGAPALLHCTLLRWTSLVFPGLCWSSLHREKCTKKIFLWYSSWFWLLPLTPAGGALLFLPDCVCHRYWFMFGVCYWAGLLEGRKSGIAPSAIIRRNHF